MVGQLLVPGDALAGLGPGEDVVQLLLGGLHAEAVVQSVVGDPAVVVVEVADPVNEGLAHILHGVDGEANHLFQLGNVSGEGGLVRPHGLVGPEGRQHHGGSGGVGSQLFMPAQIVHGIVGGADELDAGLADDAPDGHIRLGQDGVALLVDFHGVVTVQGLGDAEVALQLQVGPVVQGVANQVGHGLGPLLKFFGGGGVAGDVVLGHAAGAHGPPLVVVAAQPDLRNGVVALVLVDFLGVDVAVIVDDGHGLGMLMIELSGRFRFQQKVRIHKRCHNSISFAVWDSQCFTPSIIG